MDHRTVYEGFLQGWEAISLSMPPTASESAVNQECLPKRFTEKFIPEPMSGCWIWLACLASNGYGRFGVGTAKHIPAHRFSFEHKHGPVPPGLELDHECRVKACVNPDHVAPVTHAENMARAVMPDRRKQFCAKGHELSITSRPHGRGRRCSICHNNREKAAYHRRKNASKA
jgi:hypothetical protein